MSWSRIKPALFFGMLAAGAFTLPELIWDRPSRLLVAMSGVVFYAGLLWLASRDRT